MNTATDAKFHCLTQNNAVDWQKTIKMFLVVLIISEKSQEKFLIVLF